MDRFILYIYKYYECIVRERWKNGKALGFFPRFSLGKLVLCCAGGALLACCLKVLQELGESGMRSAKLRKKRQAREQAEMIKRRRIVDDDERLGDGFDAYNISETRKCFRY